MLKGWSSYIRPTVLYNLLRPIGILICKVLFRLKVKGLENIPRGGRAVIAVNHSSYLDPVVVGVAIPKRIKWVILKSIYHLWWLKWLFVLTEMIPENGAIEKSLSALKNDELLGIFPEGTRSRDGTLHAGREGVAILAVKGAAPVIPCAIRGAFEAYPRNALFPKPHPIKILIGSPIKFEPDEAPDEAKLAAAADKIMSAIKSLMEEKV